MQFLGEDAKQMWSTLTADDMSDVESGDEGTETHRAPSWRTEEQRALIKELDRLSKKDAKTIIQGASSTRKRKLNS